MCQRTVPWHCSSCNIFTTKLNINNAWSSTLNISSNGKKLYNVKYDLNGKKSFAESINIDKKRTVTIYGQYNGKLEQVIRTENYSWNKNRKCWDLTDKKYIHPNGYWYYEVWKNGSLISQKRLNKAK